MRSFDLDVAFRRVPSADQRRLTVQQRYYRAHREELNAKRQQYRATAEAREAKQVRVEKNAAQVSTVLHQDLSTPGYSRCVPPPVAGLTGHAGGGSASRGGTVERKVEC